MMNRIFSLRGSQADTYIEYRFEEACTELANGDKVLNEWRKRKEQYTSYTNLIIFANSHFLRTAGPHFPDSPGHIKRTAWDISRAEGTPPH